MGDILQIEVMLASETPAYKQIAEQLRTFCVSGQLAAGESLPSVRSLASNLGVHFNTVAEAYRTLADEGWLEVRQGKSVSVKARDAAATPTPALLQQQSTRLRHLVAELRGLGLTPQWIRAQIEEAVAGQSLGEPLEGKAS